MARLLLALVLVAWGLMLVGAQAGFASRWRFDREQGAELRRQVPDPVPYTMFVPLRVEQEALATGSRVLDSHFRSVWEYPWSALPFLQRVYRREDVRCGYWRHWTPGVPVRGADERGLHYDDANMVAPRFPRLPDGTNLIPWERCVPFVVERDGRLRVVTRVVLERTDGTRTIEVPQCRGLPMFEVRLKAL